MLLSSGIKTLFFHSLTLVFLRNSAFFFWKQEGMFEVGLGRVEWAAWGFGVGRFSQGSSRGKVGGEWG